MSKAGKKPSKPWKPEVVLEIYGAALEKAMREAKARGEAPTVMASRTSMTDWIRYAERLEPRDYPYVTGSYDTGLAYTHDKSPKEDEDMATRRTLTSDQVWALVERAAPHARRVLLYGPPGTGKSYLARTAGVRDGAGERVYPIVVHADLPAAELRGHFIPQVEGGLKWMDGPATSAWRAGGRLVLDEIDKAGDDALSFLLGVLDDVATARLTLGTTGEVLSPHPDFTAWATMNGEPDDLPPALRDRFPVMVEITAPHPAAVNALPQDLRALARELSCTKDEARHVGLRAFMEFANLRDLLDHDAAGNLVFGRKWHDLKDAIKLARHADVR